mmetsp:Transcript_88528/g.196872  ORF Transcript_88528/g.196872 Transcript_88528/m.196872 type:complete len:254 (-) Transcript_88528:785-1546(-)
MLTRLSSLLDLRDRLTSVAYGHQAVHVGPEIVRDRLARLMSTDKGRIWATFKLLIDESLRARKYQVLGGHTVHAKTSLHQQPGIVRRVPIEIPALAILLRLCRHGNLRVDVAPFPCLVPPVDLHRHPTRQADVQNMERLALPAWLKKLSNVVVVNAHQAIRILELRGEGGQDRLPVPSRMLFSDNQLVTLQERTSHSNLLRHSEAIGGMGRRVLTLNPHGRALHDPKLSGGVVIRMQAVEGHRVRVTVDLATL